MKPEMEDNVGLEPGGAPPREKYSLDEMVRALKDRGREDEDQGEWVTRQDGTQVKRVRKRKRRSDQPEKEEAEKKAKRSLFVQLGVLAAVVLAVAAYLGYAFFSLNSDGFAKGVEDELGRMVGAETELKQLRVGPTGATATSMTLDWGAGSYLKSLSLSDLRADTRLSDFLRIKLEGTDAVAARGELVLQKPEGKIPDFGKLDPLNHPHRFDLLACQNLAIWFGKEGAMKLIGADTTLRHLNSSGYQVRITGGELEGAGWDSLPVDNGLIGFRPGVVELVQVLFKDPTGKGGKLSLSGSVPLDATRDYQLFLSAETYPLERLVGKHLGELISGTFSTEEGVVTGRMGESLPASVIVPFSGEAVSLSKLPMWTTLDELFPDEKFLRPDFSDGSSGIFQWSPQGTGIRNLKLQNASRIKVTGNLAVSHEGLLVGTLVVSLNRGIVSKQRMFTESLAVRPGPEDTGYVTVEVKLGGTADEPSDNFRELLGLEAAPGPAEPQGGSFEDLFKELTTEPGN